MSRSMKSDWLNYATSEATGRTLASRARQRLAFDPLCALASFLGTLFFLVLGRHFPQLPLKILPRADFVSPLPISVLFACRLARAFRL